MTDISEESLLRDRARFLVALGYDDFATVVQKSTDVLEDPPLDAARRIVAEEFDAHLAEQDAWPEDLDTDRLHRAFRELDMAGIVARLDHTCCQNCGIAEIGGEFPRGEERRGYVFAHHQDMQAAVGGGSLTLSYGVLSRGTQPPEAQAETGREVAEALRRHGLDVDWNGSPGQRIDVALDWKRRRFGRLAERPGAEPAPSDEPLLISYADERRGVIQNGWIPASFAHARDVLLTMPPYAGSFMNFRTPSGGGLISMWGSGPVLTFESPLDEASVRQVTIAEAERLLWILAHEGRAALGDDLPDGG